MNACRGVYHAPFSLSVPLTVAPQASAGCARCYPSGPPVLAPICDTLPGRPAYADARYLIRQPFIAEFPVALRAGARAHNPVVIVRRPKRRATAKQE